MKWDSEKLVELGLEKYMKWHKQEEKRLNEAESLVDTNSGISIDNDKTLAARIEALEQKEAALYASQDMLTFDEPPKEETQTFPYHVGTSDEQVDLSPITNITPGQRIDLYREHEKDKRIDRFKFRGFGLYAVDKAAARKVFRTRSLKKPRWAVSALVILRDQKCSICSEDLTKCAEVKQLVPVKLGGSYSEPNCIAVCVECTKVWTSKNFYLTNELSRHFLEHRLYLLRRRQEGRLDAKPLSEKGREVFYILRREYERIELQRNTQITTFMESVLPKKPDNMSDYEFYRKLFKLKKAKDDSVSDNEVKESEKSMNVEE